MLKQQVYCLIKLKSRMNKIFLCLLLILSFSCSTKKSLTNEQPPKIKVVKFMGIDMYSHEINKKLFWTYDEEHMFMYMKKGEFLSDIEKYRKEKESSVKEYIYAFITPTDTLYSDYSLQSWILIRDKKRKILL